jgi:hypothetical protein
MAILNATSYPTGLVGVIPSIVYIDTNDTLATVTTAGYLNKKVQQGFVFQESMMALVSTKTTPNATTVSVGWFDVSHSGDNWSLVPANSQLNLANGQIFVGNASGIATAVTMSGDATIANTGALTIANNAITTAKILNANVTLAKLAAGITPSHIIKFANQVTTVGGAAAEAFVVTGALAASDRAFVQVVDNGTANVTVLQAVVTNDTLTVTFSANPGNDTIINYQIIRAAA